MEKEKQDLIIRSYRKKKRINTIIMVVVFTTAFFAFWYSNNKDSFPEGSIRVLITYGICIIAIGGLALSYINWRCPACKQSLGRATNPKVCRKCGVKLQ